MNKAKVLLKKCLLPNKNNLGFFKKQLKCILMLQLLFCLSSNQAQIANYVNNGSFELRYNCTLPYISTSKYWRSLDSLTGNVDFNCTCFPNVPNGTYGFQWPRNGDSYGLKGFMCQQPSCSSINNRGYFRNRLKGILQAGKTYCVKFYINISDNSSYGIDAIGAYFGDNSLDTITKPNIPLTYLTPQIQNPVNNIITDTMNWTLITGTFVATGIEKHCVIGNFKSDAGTNKLLINNINAPNVYCNVLVDDVSCIPVDLPAYAAPGNDVWAIPGTTIYLGRPQDVGIDEACEWFKLPNTTSVIANAAGLTLTVAITTNTYMVKQTICGNINYDTVVVHASGLGLSPLSLGEGLGVRLYPNPVNDILNVEFVTLSGVEAITFRILNSLGQLIREEDVILKNNSTTLKLNELPNGVYLLNMSSRGTRDLNTDSSYRRNDNLIRVSKRFVISR